MRLIVIMAAIFLLSSCARSSNSLILFLEGDPNYESISRHLLVKIESVQIGGKPIGSDKLYSKGTLGGNFILIPSLKENFLRWAYLIDGSTGEISHIRFKGGYPIESRIEITESDIIRD